MINVGVVGFGLAGTVFHAPFVRAVEGLELKAIVRRSGERDPAYPDVEFVRSVDELLARPIDLVVVATPNATHYPIAKQCLEAGRHVVIDKPFTPTLREAEELVELAARQNKLLVVFQNRRWDGDFMTVQQLIQQNALGRVVTFETHFDRFRPDLRVGNWKEDEAPGTGLLFDLAPHLIDHALVLFGPPEAVYADLRMDRDGSRVVDAFDILFYYPRTRALLRATTMAAEVGPRFAVHGTAGSFVKYGLDPQEDAMKAGGRIGDPNRGADSPERYGTLTTRDGKRAVPTIPGDYRKFYANVRDAILGHAELAVTPQQALNVMRALELAAESSRLRCAMPWS
jgi:scyllo-inositol 2-dehydrogenase (NADP+)